MKKPNIFIFILLLGSFAFLQKQNQSLENLQKAYQAEANASRRYEMFAKKATEENHEQIAKLFRAVSKSESVHMQNHKKAIEAMGGTPEG